MANVCSASNTAIGYYSGFNTHSPNNIVIGRNAGYGSVISANHNFINNQSPSNINPFFVNNPPIEQSAPSIPIKIVLLRKMPENMAKSFSSEDRECSICLEEIKTNEVYTSSNCFHMYHKECLEKMECICATCRK